MNAQSVSIPLNHPVSIARRQNRAEKARLDALKAEHHFLLEELSLAEKNLHAAWNNFDYLYEAKTVDVCIYQIQTHQSQYDNILCKLKILRQQLKEYSV